MEPSNTKCKALLTAGRELFWKYGFKRVTIEEICKKAGVSKMTYYKFYPNKLELARSVFDMVAENGASLFRSIMTEDIPPAEKIMKMLQLKHEGTNEVSREFLADFYNNPELGLKDHIEKQTLRIWNEIIDDFRQAQNKGVFRKDFKPEIIWYLSEKMMGMINDPRLLKLYNTPQEMIMDLASLFVYGIAPQK
jgi:AcrR family transcriptional regulator